MKQIYMITYPTGKIYIGKDSVGSYRYFGSLDMDIINEDFEQMPDDVRKDYKIRKQIMWESEDCDESELSTKEVEYIRQYQSNNPKVGYNRWPKSK
ncbi:MAG: GIY-YIG nuclease family protein [Candidatus Scalindua sp.]